jgi:YVTN family beta-propeller protein
VPDETPPEPSYLYVTESVGDTLGVYDPLTYQLVESVSVGDDPRGLSYDTLRQRVLISLLDGTVLSLDAADLAAPVQSTAPVVDDGSLALYYEEVGDAVWVTSLSLTNNVVALAADTLLQLSGSPVLDSELVGMATIVSDPGGEKIYITKSVIGDGAVAVIDAATRALLHVVDIIDPGGDLNEAADGLAYHPEFEHLYVGSTDFDGQDDNSVLVLDTSLDPPAILQRVPCGQDATSIALDLSRDRIYVTNYSAGAVQIFSITDSLTPLALLDTLATGNEPVSVVYDEVNDRIITSNFASNTLTVYDADTLQELAGSPFPTGDGPNGVYLRLVETP